MKTSMFLAAASAALLVAACSGTTTPPPDGSGDPPSGTGPAPSAEPAATATAEVPSSSTGVGKMCGGIGMLPCPDGLECVDDPADQCDPARGGRDCSGICVPRKAPSAGSACDRPERKYVAREVDRCAAIRFVCEKDYGAFHDDCGCGCEPEKAGSKAQGERCKDKVCGPDQFCCNASCGICAPRGGACTQQVCN